MKYVFYLVKAIFLLACLVSCGRGAGRDGSTGAADSVEIVRLERNVYAASMPEPSDMPMLRAMGKMLGFNADTALAAYSRTAAVRVFTPDVEAVYPTLDSLEAVIGEVEANMRGLLPEAGKHSRRYASIISPYRQSVYLYADTIVFIALNHYLGAGYPGYEGRFPDYERMHKTAARIPYDVAEAVISSAYPFRGAPDGATLASRMLYEGAVALAVERIVPGATDADALGYDRIQWEWLVNNERPAWEALAGRKLLYSTSGSDAIRMLRPSPASQMIHPEAPGRIGRFFGLRMVRSYLEAHPETEPADLLSPDFYSDDRTVPLTGYSGGKS